MIIKIRILGICAVMLLLSLTSVTKAQVVQDSVSELRKIDIDEHLGVYVPLDLVFTDDLGKEVRLGDYFHRGKPVVLFLGYYECPMLCNLVMNGVTDGIKQLDWKPGVEFLMLSVSINPSETYPLAASKKKNYLQALNIPSAAEGWSFLVGQESQSKALADAVGFKYYWDDKQKQYAHPAAIYLLADDGKITRYLYGIQFTPLDLKLGLMEASRGQIGNTVDRLILYCYHYDPDAQGYVVFAGNVMKLGGLATVVLLGLLMGGLWYRERRRRA